MALGSIRRVFSAPTLIDALWGGAGFIGSKMLAAWLPVPAQFKVGPARILVNAVSAWALGFVGSQVGGRKVGNLLLLGGLVATATDALQTFVPQLLPMRVSGDYEDSGYMVGSYLPSESLSLAGDTGGW